MTSSVNDPIVDATKKEYQINTYYFVSNTRMIVLFYDCNEHSLRFQVATNDVAKGAILTTTIPGFSEKHLNKLLTTYNYKSEMDIKAKPILDRFNYGSIEYAKFMNECDFDDFVRVEIWPQFNYTKTDLAKASYYLPKDDKGNYVVDINTDIGDLSFYKSVLECERLLNN
jgi:hypothetical protein